MKSAQLILADNLRTLMERTPHLASQNSIAKASGVAQTTIGNWRRREYTSHRLEQVEAVAGAFHITVGELLSENLGERAAQNHDQLALSDSASQIASRLTQLERAGSASPQLIQALHAVLNIAGPDTGGEYPGLNGVFKD